MSFINVNTKLLSKINSKANNLEPDILYENNSGTTSFPITLNKSYIGYMRFKVIWSVNHGGDNYFTTEVTQTNKIFQLQAVVRDPTQSVLFFLGKPVSFRNNNQLISNASAKEMESVHGFTNIYDIDIKIYKIIGYKK